VAGRYFAAEKHRIFELALAGFLLIVEVLILRLVRGVQACNLGVPILAEELSRK